MPDCEGAVPGRNLGGPVGEAVRQMEQGIGRLKLAAQVGDQAQVDDPVLADDHPADGAEQPLVDLPNLYRTLDSTTAYGYPSSIERRRTLFIRLLGAAGSRGR